ncbi:MAG: siroheme synthase CysG [Steroidobacterales bacterium]|jgi:uroporphyrin-III C-methyltransferase/precorrin-2 dehydrogenase/sirohydrochlorin ferrochelatase
MDYLPVFLRLNERPALIVGGGRVAARKVEWLVRSGARVTVVAPQLHPELQACLSRGECAHLASVFAPEQLAGVAVVVAATDDETVNAAVSDAARRRDIPVNVVDAPELSTFIFPAIIDRSPILVAVSSAGTAPVLTRRVREQIEALLPTRLGRLARFMGERRREVKKALGFLARRAFWERIVGGTTATCVLAGDEAGAAAAFAGELRTSQLTRGTASEHSGGGEVYLIGAGPGDPDLLTLRALQLLQQADVILYDRLVPQGILERARRDAERIPVGKEVGEHRQQQRIHELLLQLTAAGKRVARLKGGDPFIFGRGGEEIELLAAHNIPYIVVPGITAALGAAAAAEIPLTHRRLAHSVTFVTGHAGEDGELHWEALAQPRHTVVFYMGIAQLPAIVAKLRAAGARADHPAAIVERAALPGQRVLRSDLQHIAALAARERIVPPALLIVGAVAAFGAADAVGALAVAAPARQALA